MSRADKEPRNHALAAAMIGGAVAATAGAVWSARAIARRNDAGDGKPVNSVMQTAMTACEVSHGHTSCEEIAPESRGPAAEARELAPTD